MKPPTSRSEHYVDVVRKLTPELEVLADQIEAEDRIPPRTYELLIENDLLRLTLPEAWGGQGFSVAEYVPVLQEVAKISGALRMMIHGQNGMWRLVEQWGTQAQKDHWLPDPPAGGTFTFGLTEPDNGTGRDISTTAVRDGDEWVINGRKHLISWAGSAELVHLIAATDKDHAGGAIATCFLLPKDTPGVVCTPLPPTMGCKGVHHDIMDFEDCRLPADSVLGEVGQGLHLGLRGFLDVSRLGIAISALGLAHRALELATRVLQAAGHVRQADRQPPGGEAGDRRDGQRHLRRRPRRDGRRSEVRRRRVDRGGGGDVQAPRHRDGRTGHRPGAADARRHRLHRGPQDRAPLPRCAGAVVRRRHGGDPEDRGGQHSAGGRHHLVTNVVAAPGVEERFSAEEIARYRELGLWGDDVLADLVERAATDRPDGLCVSDGETTYSFAEAHQRAGRLAGGLAGLGIGPGDRVVVQLPNWADAVVTYYAIGRLGAVIVPRMLIYREHEVRDAVDRTEAKALVVADSFRNFDYAAMAMELQRQCPSLEHVVVIGDVPDGAVDLESLCHGAPYDGPKPDPHDHHIVLFTSGTTAQPKGVVHTWNTYVTAGKGLAREYRLTADDVCLMPSPVMHNTGLLAGIVAPLIAQGGTVVQPIWEPHEGLSLITRFGCTYSVGATPFVTMMVDAHDPA